MFRHILVPLDGSSCAEQVLPVAARLARSSEGTITLLRVVDLTYDTVTYGLGASYISQNIIDDELSSAQRYLAQWSKHRLLEGIVVYTQVASGNPAAAIIAQAAQPPTDLVVISSHGYTGVKRWLLGSVAEKVARHALVPVLVVRDKEPLHTHKSSDHGEFVRALVVMDTLPHSQAALVPAAELVAALSTADQGKLHLAQIVVPPEGISATEREELLQSVNQHLLSAGQSIRNQLLARFGPTLRPELSWSAALTNDIAEGIVQIAEHGEESTAFGKMEGCDLIALTTHGPSGLHLWPVGGIAERVLHETRLPLLIVHPEEVVEEEHRKRHQPLETAM